MSKQQRPIEKLLIANRGEIACRIARTCRELGIATVAVFSDADADNPHVRACDEAVRIGPAPAAESYLKIDAVLAAAARAGADAVHPGFGFLAENAAFARAVIDAGLTWIGPSPEAMEALGSKVRARAIAQDAGVPVLQGSNDATPEAAAAIGYPLLIKASAGGGGKGMRVVREPAGFEEAAAASRREALAAFGDDTLFIERFVERPRHVEVQILGDTHGTVAHLFERDCSIQRRHQKIVEESPAPGLSDATRQALFDAAVKLGEAVGYVGAGTVEFLVEGDPVEGERFYFLEVNARLQVEHPVTEQITGLDLVACQIAVAEGGRAPLQIKRRGAAIEVRIYAEDADAGWLPQTGRIALWAPPTLPGIRVESGVETGGEVSVHYDPMLAKIIATGRDRGEARRRLCRALEQLRALGLTTNRAHLLSILRHPAFVAGDVHTGFLEEHGVSAPSLDDGQRGALARVAACVHELSRPRAYAAPTVPKGWRSSRFRDAELVVAGEAVRWRVAGDGWVIGIGDVSHAVSLVSRDGAALTLEIDGHRRTLTVVDAGDRWHVGAGDFSATLERDPPFPLPEEEAVAGGCVAPMTGTVRQITVAVGDAVAAGDALVVLEAMKMENTLRAVEAGRVAEVRVSEGQVVDAGAVLVVLEAAEDA